MYWNISRRKKNLSIQRNLDINEVLQKAVHGETKGLGLIHLYLILIDIGSFTDHFLNTSTILIETIQ